MDYLVEVLVILAFVQSQVALVFAAVAFSRSRKEETRWEPTEADLEYADKQEAFRRKMEADIQKLREPEDFNSLSAQFNKLAGR